LLIKFVRSNALPITMLLAAAMVLARTLAYPMGTDNQLYAYMAKLWLDGFAPYVGSWDQNFPGIIVIHAVEQVLLGDSILAFRVWDAMFQLLTAFLVYLVASRHYDRRAGWVAGFIYALCYTHQNMNFVGERELYITLSLLGIIHLTKTHRRYDLLVGLLIGFAVLIRPTSGLFGIPLLIVTYRQGSSRSVFTMLLGASLPLTVTLAYFLAISGIDEFYEATIGFTTAVYNRLEVPTNYFDEEALRGYWRLYLFLPLGIYYVIRSRKESLLLFGFAFISAAVLLLLHRLPYHYQPLITFLIVFCGVGLVYLADQLADRLFKDQTVLRSLLIATLVFVVILTNFRGAFMFEWGKKVLQGEELSLEILRTKFNSIYPDEVAVARYLTSHTASNDRVQGIAPLMPMYLADRAPSSRFITAPALVMRSASGKLTEFQVRWREEYLGSMSTKPPRYYIMFDGDQYSRRWLNGNAGHEVLTNDLTEVYEFLQKNYDRDTVIGDFTLYRLR
jgi:hypothetical protein